MELDAHALELDTRLMLGVKQGEFSLCATVKGVEGCLNGTVTSGH